MVSTTLLFAALQSAPATLAADHPGKSVLFVAGCIGAIAPEILRLYELARQGKAGNVPMNRAYFVASALYVLLGGFVATIAPGVTTAWWAFCIGAGLVTVVNTAIKAVGNLSNLWPESGTGELTAGAEAGPWHARFSRAL